VVAEWQTSAWLIRAGSLLGSSGRGNSGKAQQT
jgi:hypothetical protein